MLSTSLNSFRSNVNGWGFGLQASPNLLVLSCTSFLQAAVAAKAAAHGSLNLALGASFASTPVCRPRTQVYGIYMLFFRSPHLWPKAQVPQKIHRQILKIAFEKSRARLYGFFHGIFVFNHAFFFVLR